ncbi:MAG: histidine kinase [Pseudomonadota bacterium]
MGATADGEDSVGGLRLRVFWTFQALFWSAVFVWRTMFNYAFGHGFLNLELRAISIALAVWATYAAAVPIGRLTRRRLNAGSISLVAMITAIVAVIHTAADRVLYTAAYNGWVYRTPELVDAGQLLSLNTYVFAAWTAFFLVIQQFTLSSRRERALERLESMAREARLELLMRQLNPHFLFNALTSLSTLVAEGRARQADEMIMRLSRFLRRAVDVKPGEMTSLAEEMALLQDYVQIQKVRFGDRLRFSLDLDPRAGHCAVPPMLLQPLIENSIAHGASDKGRIEIEVTARLENGSLRIEARDLGPGFPCGGEGPRGAGLRLVAERLEGEFGAEATLALSNPENGGALVSITTPARPPAANDEAVA